MGREVNVIIFQDTEHIVKGNEILKEAVKNSTDNQIFIAESEEVSTDGALDKYEAEADIVISKKRSYEAASAYKGMKTCVHNFASSTTPGGGVVRGSSAQEECLCRCSTLYFSLNTPEMWDKFYMPHRETGDPKHNDDIIYTPEVYVIKTDTAEPTLMSQKDWYPVDVLTCAAPNLRQMPSNKMNVGDGYKKVKMLDEDLQALHEKRFSKILDVAASQGNEVLILGAFGCGAFENNPEVVAKAVKNVLGKYLHAFKCIEFAIYCSPRDEANYTIFKDVLEK